MTKTEIDMHRIHLEGVAAYLSGKQKEPDDAPSQHRAAVNRALKDLERLNAELEKTRAYNAVLVAVMQEHKMIYGDQGEIVGRLIRCKDCNNRGTSDCPIEELCHGWIPDDNWYCADAEAKE